MQKCFELSTVSVDLTSLYLYRRNSQLAKHKYMEYTKACQSINSALHVLLADKTCQKLSRELFLVNNDLLVHSSGYADASGILSNDDTDPSLGSLPNRMLAKAIGRKLLHDLHPDRGGDRHLFQQVLFAVMKGDVVFLQYVQGVQNANLTWQCRSGVQFMREIASLYRARMAMLRSHPLSLVARKYMAHHRDEALKLLQRHLQLKLSERRIELQTILTRS